MKSVPGVEQYFGFHQAVYASTVYIELEQINIFFIMVENMNDTCTLKPFLMHLFNKYSLISIPRVGEMISVELKRNCFVWTGIHLANVVQFAPFPVKICTSVFTVGHYCNKASGLGLQTSTAGMRIAFATLLTAADARTSL